MSRAFLFILSLFWTFCVYAQSRVDMSGVKTSAANDSALALVIPPAVRDTGTEITKHVLKPLENAPLIENKDILGKWQMESTEMADGYYYTYSFMRGNVFVFGNDENEGLNRIISLTGTYYLKKDTIIIYVKQEYDLVGGTPELSEKLAGSGWEIKGGKIMLKDLPVVKQYYLPIRTCPEKDNKKCLEINSMSYYKLE